MARQAALGWDGERASEEVTAPVPKTRHAVVQMVRRSGFRVLAAVFALTHLNRRMLIGFLLPVLIAQGPGMPLQSRRRPRSARPCMGAGGPALLNGAAFGIPAPEALSVRRG